MNTGFAPVVHTFKYAFNIELYNSMWSDGKAPSINPTIQEICGDILLPPPIEDQFYTSKVLCYLARYYWVRDVSLPENSFIDAQADSIFTEFPLTIQQGATSENLATILIISKDKLYFIAYKGANTIKPK